MWTGTHEGLNCRQNSSGQCGPVGKEKKESERKSCPTFCDPHGLQSMELSKPGHWSGQPFSSPGDLPNPGIKPRPPTLQEESLPVELQGKPKNTAVGSLSLLQGIIPTQESNQGLLHRRWILYQLSYHGSPRTATASPLPSLPSADHSHWPNLCRPLPLAEPLSAPPIG